MTKLAEPEPTYGDGPLLFISYFSRLVEMGYLKKR